MNVFKTDSVTGLPLFDTYDDSNIKNDMGLTNADPFTPYTGTLDPRLDHTVGRRGIPMLDWGLFRVDWVYDQANRGPYASVKSFFWKTIRMRTPVVMAESARLNTGRKKTNSSPPTNGNQVG